MKTAHSDAKSPGFWLYTADLERDFQILSLQAQGLAMRMLCWMHNNELHRGFLELPTGSPMTDEDIAAKVGKPIVRVRTALQELDHYGVFSRDSRGCIYSRRMAREFHISEVRRAAARSRLESSKRAANGTFAGDFAPAKQPPKGEQNPTVSDSVSDSVLSDSESKQSTSKTEAINSPKGGWRTDESFQPIVTAYRESGAACIDEDFADTWWFVWRKLDFEQKLERTKAFKERVECGVYDVPKMIPRIRKFVEQEWKRPIASGERKPVTPPSTFKSTMDPETRATLEQWKRDHPEDTRWS